MPGLYNFFSPSERSGINFTCPARIAVMDRANKVSPAYFFFYVVSFFLVCVSVCVSVISPSMCMALCVVRAGNARCSNIIQLCCRTEHICIIRYNTDMHTQSTTAMRAGNKTLRMEKEKSFMSIEISRSPKKSLLVSVFALALRTGRCC